MVGQDVMRCLMALGLVLQGFPSAPGGAGRSGGAVPLRQRQGRGGARPPGCAAAVHRQGLPGPQRPGPGYPHRTAGADRRGTAAAQAAQAQASSDAQLLRLYSSLEDVDRARERRLAELDGLSSVARATCSRSSCNRPTCKARRPTRSVPDVRWRRRWWTSWTISSRRSACKARSGVSRRPRRRGKNLCRRPRAALQLLGVSP